MIESSGSKTTIHTDLSAAEWLNQPGESAQRGSATHLTTDANTDFWRTTFYGFERHSGHALGYRLDAGFTVQVKVRGVFETLYDQAGLFIRDDASHWVKTGIEYNDAAPSIGSVVTDERSDWATGVFPGDAACFWLRATAYADYLRIQYSTDGVEWPLLRLCAWPMRRCRFVGVMACSPERAGLRVTFDEFWLGPPQVKPLHDLS